MTAGCGWFLPHGPLLTQVCYGWPQQYGNIGRVSERNEGKWKSGTASYHQYNSGCDQLSQQGIENFPSGCKGPHSSRTGKVAGRIDIFQHKKDLRFLKLEMLTFSAESKI